MARLYMIEYIGVLSPVISISYSDVVRLQKLRRLSIYC